MSSATQILQNSYEQARQNNPILLSSESAQWVKILRDNAESQKAVLTVLITSLTYKIEHPTQDIRQHQVELPNGYSGRGYDTKYITPFLRQTFPRLVMAESGWLTRSLEQAHAFTLDFPGRIRNKAVKEAFLNILHHIETGGAAPQTYLVSIFQGLLEDYGSEKLASPMFSGQQLAISEVIQLLDNHFNQNYNTSGASRLPVLALFSIYQILIDKNSRYSNKRLALLKSHTTADSRTSSIGDIEIFNQDNTFFEAIEVKFGKPITIDFLTLTAHKIKNHPVSRYYLLTTSQPNIKIGQEKEIEAISNEILHASGCEVIVNGVMPTLKYYLRLIENPMIFLNHYTALVYSDTALKHQHRDYWSQIVKP